MSNRLEGDKDVTGRRSREGGRLWKSQWTASVLPADRVAALESTRTRPIGGDLGTVSDVPVWGRSSSHSELLHVQGGVSDAPSWGRSGSLNPQEKAITAGFRRTLVGSKGHIVGASRADANRYRRTLVEVEAIRGIARSHPRQGGSRRTFTGSNQLDSQPPEGQPMSFRRTHGGVEEPAPR